MFGLFKRRTSVEDIESFLKSAGDSMRSIMKMLNIFPSYDTNYEAYRQEVYRNPSVSAAYTPLQNAFLNIEFKTFKTSYKTVDGKKIKTFEPSENEWVSKTLNKPNPLLSRTEFMEYLLFYYVFGGRNLIQRVDGYKTSDLVLFAPNCYTLEYRTDCLGLKKIIFGAKTIIGSELEKFHLMKALDPKSSIAGISAGASPLEALGPICDLINFMVKHNTSLLKNKGHKNGLFKQTGSDNQRIGKKQREEFEQKLKEALEGYQKAGKIGGILPLDVEYIDTSVAPSDLDWVNGWVMAHKMVANILGVPLSMVWDTAATYNNAKEDKKKLYKNTVLPLAKRCAEFLTDVFRPHLGVNEVVWFDVSAIEELRSDIMDTIDKLNNSKFLTVNDKRLITTEMTGLEIGKYNHVNADRVFVSSAETPIDFIVEDEDDGGGSDEE